MIRSIIVAIVAALVLVLPAAAGGQDKVFVCHDGKTLKIAKAAVKAHLKHGDTAGRCTTPGPPVTPGPVDVDVPVTTDTFSQVNRILACASAPVFRQEDGTLGIAADLDLSSFDSGAYDGATLTIARFYEGVGATCDKLGGAPTGETIDSYPIWVR